MQKKSGIYVTIILITLIILLAFFIKRNNMIKVKSTDLGMENISGISLKEKYDSDKIKKVLGNDIKKSIKNKESNYEYVSNDFIVGLNVDKHDSITGISVVTSQKNDIKTSKGITNGSSFNDITRLYGNNYVKKEWKDDMGSGDGYSITYFDKINRYRIEFGFSKVQDKESVSSINLSVY